jgi:hypothetical protein
MFMSIVRHHNIWLSLFEIPGPFLSLPTQIHNFPQRLLALRRILAAIPGEIEQEKTAILKRFSEPHIRKFPVAVMFLVPSNFS